MEGITPAEMGDETAGLILSWPHARVPARKRIVKALAGLSLGLSVPGLDKDEKAVDAAGEVAEEIIMTALHSQGVLPDRESGTRTLISAFLYLMIDSVDWDAAGAALLREFAKEPSEERPDVVAPPWKVLRSFQEALRRRQGMRKPRIPPGLSFVHPLRIHALPGSARNATPARIRTARGTGQEIVIPGSSRRASPGACP